MERELAAGKIVIIAGFQGVTAEGGYYDFGGGADRTRRWWRLALC